jgi:hypothetical protein
LQQNIFDSSFCTRDANGNKKKLLQQRRTSIAGAIFTMRKLHPTNVKSIEHSVATVYGKASSAMLRLHRLTEWEDKNNSSDINCTAVCHWISPAMLPGFKAQHATFKIILYIVLKLLFELPTLALANIHCQQEDTGISLQS